MSDVQQVRLDDEDEWAQAARILTYVAAEKKKIAEKLASLDAIEKDARSVVEDALGGEDGPASEAIFENRTIVKWSKYTTHRLDQKGLKKTHPDIFDEFYEETVGRRFTVLAPEEEA